MPTLPSLGFALRILGRSRAQRSHIIFRLKVLKHAANCSWHRHCSVVSRCLVRIQPPTPPEQDRQQRGRRKQSDQFCLCPLTTGDCPAHRPVDRKSGLKPALIYKALLAERETRDNRILTSIRRRQMMAGIRPEILQILESTNRIHRRATLPHRQSRPGRIWRPQLHPRQSLWFALRTVSRGIDSTR